MIFTRTPGQWGRFLDESAVRPGFQEILGRNTGDTMGLTINDPSGTPNYTINYAVLIDAFNQCVARNAIFAHDCEDRDRTIGSPAMTPGAHGAALPNTLRTIKAWAAINYPTVKIGFYLCQLANDVSCYSLIGSALTTWQSDHVTYATLMAGAYDIHYEDFGVSGPGFPIGTTMARMQRMLTQLNSCMTGFTVVPFMQTRYGSPTDYISADNMAAFIIKAVAMNGTFATFNHDNAPPDTTEPFATIYLSLTSPNTAIGLPVPFLSNRTAGPRLIQVVNLGDGVGEPTSAGVIPLAYMNLEGFLKYGYGGPGSPDASSHDNVLAAGVTETCLYYAYGQGSTGYKIGKVPANYPGAPLDLFSTPINQVQHAAKVGVGYLNQFLSSFISRKPRLHGISVYGGAVSYTSATDKTTLNAHSTICEQLDAAPIYDTQSSIDFTDTACPHVAHVTLGYVNKKIKTIGHSWELIGIANLQPWLKYESGMFADVTRANMAAQLPGKWHTRHDQSDKRMIVYCPNNGPTVIQRISFAQFYAKLGYDIAMDFGGFPAGDISYLVQWFAELNAPACDGNIDSISDNDAIGVIDSLECCVETTPVQSSTSSTTTPITDTSISSTTTTTTTTLATDITSDTSPTTTTTSTTSVATTAVSATTPTTSSSATVTTGSTGTDATSSTLTTLSSTTTTTHTAIATDATSPFTFSSSTTLTTTASTPMITTSVAGTSTTTTGTTTNITGTTGTGTSVTVPP